jgi:hypothetical protein
VKTVRDEMKLIVLAAGPRHLHKHNSFHISNYSHHASQLSSVTSIFNKATNVKCFFYETCFTW